MKTYIVDSFTDAAFKGNPAGVCIVESDIADSVMLNIAKELNLSETAFIRQMDAKNRFSIRFFSPKMEIPLCGHATLASARVVFEEFNLTKVNFFNKHDINLAARMSREHIQMLFPKYSTSPAQAPAALIHALGISSINNACFNVETKILLIEIDSISLLKQLSPNFVDLVKTHEGINGVLVTAASGSDGFDFHSRYFWPWSGSDEDPVTGSTHTFLAPYWAHRLGKSSLKSYQASSRSGFMDVEIFEEQVQIGSQAVIVLVGNLLL